MRTKHVLMTTALMAMFAACTNDDFISNGQGVQSGEAALRPQVDVTLNVLGDGDADTRLAYNGDYKFEDGKDVIGALLMDKLVGTDRPFNDLEAWEAKPWLQRYELVDYINTDYPFTRENGQWSTNAKMLEGNYFFAFPFASYEGYREAVHSIGEQVQEGQDIDKAYADNQFFIGYSRIHAGTQGEEVMNASLELVPTLGTVGIQVKNVGTGELQVKKIVLATDVEEANRAYGLSTLIKIDPTQALYKGEEENANSTYNLDLTKLDKNYKWTATSGDFFNYANYEEMHKVGDDWKYNEKFTERYAESGELVNNTEKSDNYNRREALRAVVKGVPTSDQRAELTINNSPVLKSQEYANFAIMTNVYEYNADAKNQIYAYVYTDKGMVGPVSLYDVKTEVTANPTVNGLTVISNNPVVKINPNHKITVALAIDNNSVQGPQTMDIYNEEDLAQFIEWNENLQRVNTAVLKNDITLTKEMSDMLTAANWSKSTFIIEPETGKKLEIAAGAAADILDHIIVNGDVEVLGKIELGTNSFVNGNYDTSDNDATKSYTVSGQELTIAEGANVTVSSAIEYKTTGAKKNQALVVAENEGTLTIDKDVAKLTVEENKGEMNVNAIVSLNGKSENKPNGVIKIGEKGQLNCGQSHYLTNKGQKLGSGEIEYAVINNDGKIFDLKNDEYGKVIVGEDDAVRTNVFSNDGIIDLTANIASNLNKREGTISYTVVEDNNKPVTMADIVEYEISELILDGGSVTSADEDEAGASNLAKLVVTENGGSIGGEEASSLTNAAAKIEINGNVTLENLTIAATGEIFVKNGTTTINGTVDASEATFKLGSYEDYKVQTGVIDIPSAEDHLLAKAITRDDDDKVKKDNARVTNNGTVTLETKPDTDNSVAWDGNKYSEKDEEEEPDYAGDAEGVYTLTSVSQLQEDLKSKDFSNVTTVNVSGTNEIRADKDNWTAIFNLLNGKDVIMSVNSKIADIPANSGLTLKTLTLEGDATLSTGNDGRGTLITVEKLDIKSNKLTLWNAYLVIEGAGQVGTYASSDMFSYSKPDKETNLKDLLVLEGGAMIVTNNVTGSGYVMLDENTGKWAEIK